MKTPRPSLKEIWDRNFVKRMLTEEPFFRDMQRRVIEHKIAQAVERQEMHRQNALAYLHASDAALKEERRLREELHELNFPVPRRLFE